MSENASLLKSGTKLAGILNAAKENKKQVDLIKMATKIYEEIGLKLKQYSEYIETKDTEPLQKKLEELNPLLDGKNPELLEKTVKELKQESAISFRIWEDLTYKGKWTEVVKDSFKETQTDEKPKPKTEEVPFEITHEYSPIARGLSKKETPTVPREVKKQRDSYVMPAGKVYRDTLSLDEVLRDDTDAQIFEFKKQGIRTNNRTIYNIGVFLVNQLDAEGFKKAFEKMCKKIK